MDSQQIKCILLTLRTENVIVPNAAVAEIISLRGVKKVDDAPKWLVGKMQWRDVEIPVVSFEAAAEGDNTVVGANQAAIIHLISDDGNSGYPYVALTISGVPHVSLFKKNQIVTDNESTKVHPMVAQRIRINGAAASILDIDSIAMMINRAAL